MENTATCGKCGSRRSGTSGYCRSCHTDYCRLARAGALPEPEPRACNNCGATYRPRTMHASKFCSRICKDRRRATPREPKACLHCASTFVPVKYAYAAFCGRACRNAAHRLQTKLRMRTGQTTKPGPLRAQIAVRDAWACQLCKQGVDPAIPYGDPMYGTLDHVVPVSRGGTNEFANLQLAHMVCNQRKSNRAGVP